MPRGQLVCEGALVMDSRRVYYIDWLRVLAVLLLIPFHAGRVFNWGEPFYAKSSIISLAVAYFLGVINMWHMPLLFFLAGASTYLALRRRSLTQYAGERSLRLLVPLALRARDRSAPDVVRGAQQQRLQRLAGRLLHEWVRLRSDEPLRSRRLLRRTQPGSPVVILFLFIIPIAAIPLLVLDKTDRGSKVIGRASEMLSRPAWWALVAFLILVSETFPEIGGKNIFFYALYFTLGYALIRHESFTETASRLRWPVLAVGGVLTLVMTGLFPWSESLPDPSPLRTLVTLLEDGAGWLMVVALIGFGRELLDRDTPALRYLASASYPLYILHQTVIVALGFHLVRWAPQPLIGWPLLMILATAVTFGSYEVVRRVGPLRFAFGIKASKRPSSATATTPATP